MQACCLQVNAVSKTQLIINQPKIYIGKRNVYVSCL